MDSFQILTGKNFSPCAYKDLLQIIEDTFEQVDEVRKAELALVSLSGTGYVRVY